MRAGLGSIYRALFLVLLRGLPTRNGFLEPLQRVSSNFSRCGRTPGKPIWAIRLCTSAKEKIGEWFGEGDWGGRRTRQGMSAQHRAELPSSWHNSSLPPTRHLTHHLGLRELPPLYTAVHAVSSNRLRTCSHKRVDLASKYTTGNGSHDQYQCPQRTLGLVISMALELFILPASSQCIHPPPPTRPLRIRIQGPLESIQKLLPKISWHNIVPFPQPGGLQLASLTHRALYSDKALLRTGCQTLEF